MDDDPDGMELTQEALGECFPRMKYVGSMSFGSNVGKDRSPDGQGYGPIYQPNRYSFSAAFLATENFRDKDSLSARMIQSRFTGHWRFACQCWKDFMADPSHAAAGVSGPEAGQGNNPEEFTSAYDRNFLLMATILFKESFEFETGGTFELDPLRLWREQCEEPAGFRNAVPTWMWRSDPKVYGAPPRCCCAFRVAAHCKRCRGLR